MTKRERLRGIGGRLRSRDAVVSLTAIFAAAFVWFVFPLFGSADARPLAPTSIRLAAILLIVLAWGSVGFLSREPGRQERARAAAQARLQTEARTQSASLIAEIDRDLADFLRCARRARRSRPLVDRLRTAWKPVRGRASHSVVLLVGARGSGRSRLASRLTSGLPFSDIVEATTPLVDLHVSPEVTALEFNGDLIGQADQRSKLAWPRLLAAFGRWRAVRPADAVVLCLAADELGGMSREEILRQGQAVALRLMEMEAQFRRRPPLYLVVTKADALVGFEALFDTLGSEERHEPLGFSLSERHTDTPALVRGRLQRGFEALSRSFGSLVIARLHEEPDELRRRQIAEFPSAFLLLRDPLDRFVQALTAARGSRRGVVPRAVFFTSVVQEPSRIDMAMRRLGPRFCLSALARRNDDFRVQERDRDYFSRKLLTEAIPVDAAAALPTVVSRLGAEARRLAGYGALASATLLGSWALGSAVLGGLSYVETLNGRTDAVEEALDVAGRNERETRRIQPVVALLDSARALVDERPRGPTLALYSAAGPAAASQDVYVASLREFALRYVRRYLEDRLDDPRTPAETRLAQTKLYLMTAGERPLEASVAAGLAVDFSIYWEGLNATSSRVERIDRHLSALGDLQGVALPADRRRIDAARRRLTDFGLARIAYERALAIVERDGPSSWRPVDHMSMAGPSALSRFGGRSFWDGIAGAFTPDGHDLMKVGAAERAAAGLFEDLWIFEDEAFEPPDPARIRSGVLQLFRSDYVSAWDGFLSELDLAPTNDPAELARVLSLVVARPSPVAELLTAVAAQTDLEPSSLVSSFPGTLRAPADVVQLPAGSRAFFAAPAPGGLQEIAATALAPRLADDVGRFVSGQFAPLREAVVPGSDRPSPLEDVIAALEPIQRQIAHVASGGDPLELGTDAQVTLAELSSRIDTLPEAVRPLFRRIAARSSAVLVGRSRERLAAIWASSVLPLCRVTVENRFPFDASSTRDAALADFVRLFGPDGAMTQFLSQRLEPFVDMSTRPWRWRTGSTFGLGLPDESLSMFERAFEIQRLFFAGGDLGIKLEFEPMTLSGRARGAILETPGGRVAFGHGPSSPSFVSWPASGNGETILSLLPEMDGERNVLRFRGPWALFRLLEEGSIVSAEDHSVVYEFRLGSRSVGYRVTAPTALQARETDVMRGFRCPEF